MDPIEEEVIEQPVVAEAPAVEAGEPAVEAPEQVQPEKHTHGNAGKTPWYMERISQESAKFQRAESARVEAERKAAEATALLERIQRGGEQQPPAPRTEVTQAPEFETAVQKVAEQRRMADARNDIIQRGYEEFGKSKFDESAQILAALDCTNDEFIADVIAVNHGDAHKLLEKIASDPDKAASLGRMTSRQRIAELTRMSMSDKPEAKPANGLAAVAVAPKTSSKAPAPAPAVEPRGGKVTDWRQDDASDADFSRGFDEMIAKRSGRR